MRLAAAPRWAISFADLALLLLGCFVMLHAIGRAGAPPEADSPMARPLQQAEVLAESLFEPGEARLTVDGRERVASLAARARGRAVLLSSRGVGGGGARLDAFELAAARTAAVARAAGVDPHRLQIDMAPSAAAGGQRIILMVAD